MKLKLTFLGAGSAFTMGGDNYQSNMLLELDGRKFLIDCGTDIRFSLAENGVKANEINDVYISHLHADHVGGVEWLAFSTFFDKKCPKPNLYIDQKLGELLWEQVLQGGLSSLEDRQAELATYFEIKNIVKNREFMWQGAKITLCETLHMVSNKEKIPSFGLFIEFKDNKIFLTTDTQFCPEMYTQLYKDATIIFHDCETSKFKSGVHSHYSDLITLPKEIKNKTWLYHYNPGELPNAHADGFLGFITKGQTFLFD